MKYLVILLIVCLQEWGTAMVIQNQIVPITEDINFRHFCRKTQDKGTELKVDEKLSEKINKSNPWRFFIHGWTTSPKTSPWFHTGKEAYFKRGDYNVIFVDWSKPANQSYLQSVADAKASGNFLGKFIVNLHKNGVSLDNIQLLGHSLGSHMSGFAGKEVFRLTGSKIGRITALDPAGPLYDCPALKPKEERISDEDANFVDIIHTDGGHYGMTTSVGHVDFFPNGGKLFQPGCENTGDENCSHARSTKFYVESINSKKFTARKCASYEDYTNGLCLNNIKAIFGEDCDTSLRGNFYFSTNAEPPYAKEECLTMITISE